MSLRSGTGPCEAFMNCSRLLSPGESPVTLDTRLILMRDLQEDSGQRRFGVWPKAGHCRQLWCTHRPMLRSGLQEGVPYSISRWTDISGKWTWFEGCLEAGQMVAFDPVSATPAVWSLKPEETLGLVFWTKDPAVLVASQKRLASYRVSVHMTATGWQEEEKGTPTWRESGRLLVQAAQVFKVYWRFSPIPLLPRAVLVERFLRQLSYATYAGLREVYVSFLQPNDKVSETRSPAERFELLNILAGLAWEQGVRVILCEDDRTFKGWPGPQFEVGACVKPTDFPDHRVSVDSCGCVRMADPFTVNESCRFGCTFCYAADRSLHPKKRTTIHRSLRLV